MKQRDITEIRDRLSTLSQTFTKPNARLILKDCAKHSTVLLGVEEQRTVVQ